MARSGGGPLRHPVLLQKPTANATPDGFGVVDLTDDDNWATVASRRAAITPTGGGEFFHGRQVQAQVTHMIEFRHDSATEQIGPRWRIKFGTRIFQVESAYSVNERGRRMECQCREMV